MGEYVFGHYEEYFYRKIEEVLYGILNELGGYDMCPETYKKVIFELDERFRKLKISDKYLSFEWNISTYGDVISIYFVDKVMRKSDTCTLRFDHDTCYVNVFWDSDDN